MSHLNRRNTLLSYSVFLAAAMVFVLVGRTALAYHRQDHEIDRIQRAIDALDRAHEELSDAAYEFHGHKHAAMEKIERARKILEDSRDKRLEKAVDKIQDAIDELKACIAGDPDEAHPYIRKAMHALEDAKDQL